MAYELHRSLAKVDRRGRAVSELSCPGMDHRL